MIVHSATHSLGNSLAAPLAPADPVRGWVPHRKHLHRPEDRPRPASVSAARRRRQAEQGCCGSIRFTQRRGAAAA
jgi:hypothetical protein